MAYAINVTIDFVWVADGAGSALLGQNQSNQPGYGPNLVPGAIGSAQTLRLAQAEFVPGGDAPTQANFNTAINNAATDLQSMMGEGGSYGGNPGTPLSLILAWATGGP